MTNTTKEQMHAGEVVPLSRGVATASSDIGAALQPALGATTNKPRSDWRVVGWVKDADAPEGLFLVCEGLADDLSNLDGPVVYATTRECGEWIAAAVRQRAGVIAQREALASALIEVLFYIPRDTEYQRAVYARAEAAIAKAEGK